MPTSQSYHHDMGEPKSYNDAFEQYVLAVVAEIEAKLERRLHAEEIDALLSAGSIMMLETLDMAIQHCDTKQKLEKDLEEFCLMGKRRLAAAKETVVADVAMHLRREPNEAERDLLNKAKSIHEMNMVAEKFPRGLPVWGWLLSVLFFPSGMFVAYGFARLLPWWRSGLLAVASYGCVIGFAWTMGFAERKIGQLAPQLVLSAGAVMYCAWGYVLYRIGKNADYWSDYGRRSWRIAGRFGVTILGLSVLGIVVVATVSWWIRWYSN